MLPSTGLFKSIICPHYEDGGCKRPYCHFKHAKKDDEIDPSKPANYKPTPVSLTPTLLTIVSTEPRRKKIKLEYEPTEPAINKCSSSSNYSIEKTNVPVYIPSASSKELEIIKFNKVQKKVEIEATFSDADDEQIKHNEETNTVPVSLKEKDVPKTEEESKIKVDKEKSKQENLSTEQNHENVSKNHQISLKNQENSIENHKNSSKNHESSSKDRENVSKNHKSSSKDRENVSKSHESSSKDRENVSKSHDENSSKTIENVSKNRESSSKNHKSSTKNHEKSSRKSESSSKLHEKSSKSTTTSSSSTNNHHHRSSSSSSRSQHKSPREKTSDRERRDRDKNKEKEREKSHSSSKHSSHKVHSKSDSSKHKSSSSSDKNEKDHRRKHKSSRSSTESHRKRRSREKSVKKVSNDNDQDKELSIPSPPNSIFETSDEDDIMEQCKMIFEEYNSVDPKIKPEEKKTTAPKISDDDDDAEKYEELNKRKRLAHENAINSKPLIQTTIRKPNHIQNAMQAIYRRQEIVRKQQEEAEAAALKAATEAKLLAEEAAKMKAENDKQNANNNLTPLIPRSYLTPPCRTTIRSIAPISNMLALAKAKKKVEMLRAEKQITPCQTASKAASRKAHINPAVPVNNSKPAPPVLEANSTKISYNIRMQYYNMMVNHCLNIYPSCEDAWDRAQTEELAVFKKCNTAIIYKSSALLAINKLRKESIDAGNVCTDKNKMVSHEVILAGKLGQNTSWSVNKKKKTDAASNSGDPFYKLSGDKIYEIIFDIRLTEEQLESNRFPRPGKKPGTAIMQPNKRYRPPSNNEHYCARCSKLFDLSMYDEEAIDQCNYHPKSAGYRRGFTEHLHHCCQQPAGTAGCSYGNYHVTEFIDYDNLTGFVTTIDPDDDYTPTKKDVYALDCEMCYTTNGIELTRLTVVDINSKTVYDTLVKPDNKIIDYNTVYSGITADMLKNVKRNLRDVQAILLSMFHSKTILIGHSLESDLKVLKLIHSVIVDTSVLFPHKMGPPKKRALKTLCIENLKRIIQENEKGHDSAEDAEVCIQLVKFYLRNRIT